jgi:ABC-2 type transport system ATP-binding protein
MSAGIAVEHLSKSYRRLLGEPVHALADVSLAIAPGEIFGVIGPNGAGKTTLLGCMLGFLTPDAGAVRIDGHASDDLAIRRVTGYLPERLNLDRWMTGRDFVAYHHALAGFDETRRVDDAGAAIARVGLDEQAAGRPIRKYSRGMLQRLGLAQALLGEPRYVFLDEPASGVDPAGVVLFRRLLLELKGRGATVVLNSHQLDQVERVCDRVAFVAGGRVQSVETLHAGAGLARVLRVRSLAGALERAGREGLTALAGRAGATLIEIAPPAARFSVGDDEAAARLVAALAEGGVPMIEVGPEEGRLERLFLEAPPPAPGAKGEEGYRGPFEPRPPDAPGETRP